MNHLWRMILAERYCMDRWFLLADLDEFVVLPAGRALRSVFDDFAQAPFDAICGTMLDVYPPETAAIQARAAADRLDLSDPWFFDAQPHRVPAAAEEDWPAYHGSRARLVHMLLTVPAMPLHARLVERARLWAKARLGRFGYPRVNEIRKVPLIRWRRGGWMPSVHRVALPASPDHHLPILHMKFTGDLYRRARQALRDKSYHNGSAEYVQMVELLAAMERSNASFLYPNSAPVGDHEAFRRSRLLVGF